MTLVFKFVGNRPPLLGHKSNVYLVDKLLPSGCNQVDVLVILEGDGAGWGGGLLLLNDL